MPGSDFPSSWELVGELFRDRRLKDADLPHGVTTRALGDMAESGARGAALARAGLEGAFPRILRQVHGTGIQLAGEGAPMETQEGDGWILARPGVVGVFVADCAPLFLWQTVPRAARVAPGAKSNPDGARDGSRPLAAGVFHVGWRGAKRGMPRRAVAAFAENFKILPGELSASIGPRIGSCCFRVGEDVSSQFGGASVVERAGVSFLDLGAEIGAQLTSAGVPAQAVGVCGECTSCSRELFFSYRREKQNHRMLAFLSLN